MTANPKTRKTLKKAKASPKEMMDAIAATGSQTKAAEALGLHKSTVCNALRPFRGTPEWDAMIDKLDKNSTTMRLSVSEILLDNREKIKNQLKVLSGKEYFTAIGILLTNMSKGQGSETPVFNNSNAVNVWALPQKEQSELDQAVAKAKNRLGIQIGVSQNGK